MSVKALPPLPIMTPVAAPAIELPRFAEAFSSTFKRHEEWERDQAYDDDLLPAHEREQLKRRAP